MFPAKLNDSADFAKMVEVRSTMNAREFVVVLPFVSKETFSVFELVPLPFIRNGKTFIVKNAASFIGFSGTHYVESNINFQCNSVGHFCEGNQKISYIHDESCALQLVKKTNVTNCVIGKLSDGEIFFQSSKLHHYLFFPKPTILEVNCGLKMKEFEFQGVYKLSKACSLKTSKLIISAVQSEHYSRQLFFIPDEHPTFDNSSSLKFDEETYKWQNYSNIQRNLSKLLTEQRKNVTELEIKNTLVTFKTDILLSSSVILAILFFITLAICVYCVFCRNNGLNYPQINYRAPTQHSNNFNLNTL